MIGLSMKPFNCVKNWFNALRRIKCDTEEQTCDVYTVTSDDSVRLSKLPDLLPPKDAIYEAANDLGRFKVLDTYKESDEVLVLEETSGLTFIMNVDVFDLLFSKQVSE